jgi:uncharacterized membrane protein (DUF106 family)
MTIALAWDTYPQISNFGHSILDPLILPLFNWNILYGMILLIMVISLIMTFVQKYGTDQDEMRLIKKRQKELQKEMKKYSDHPEKIMELNKEQFEFMGKAMKASMGTIVYTAIPFVILFRWLNDYFSAFEDAIKFFGMTWFWFYMVSAMIFSIIFRKIFKVD